MRLLTDDGRFGFVVTPLVGHGMFRFQIIVDGQLIGDRDPCPVGTAMKQLGDLPHLDDKRLGQLSANPVALLTALRFDEVLHDAATLSLAESLDRWLIYGYVYEGGITMIAQAYEEGAVVGSISVSVVGSAEYDSIVDAVRSYWLKINNDAG